MGNGRLDILAANQLGHALYTDMYARPERPPNHARFIFLDPRSQSFYPNWNKAADDTVAILHTTAGRDPYDRALTDLIGELSTRSDDFRTRWAAHNVRQHFTGRKHFHHPIVGGAPSALRGHGTVSRQRLVPLRLQPRAGYSFGRCDPAPRELGRDERRARADRVRPGRRAKKLTQGLPARSWNVYRVPNKLVSTG